MRALWAVPVGLLAFGFAAALTRLLPNTVTGAFRDILVGGAWSLAGIVVAHTALRGLEYRACKS